MKALLTSMPRWVLMLIALVIFGLVRSPFENRLQNDLIEAKLLLPTPAQDSVQQMTQSALMGTLGGIRTLVSSYLVLLAFDHFSYKRWEELRNTYSIITSLEPNDENHWREVVWHLGINATANMEIDESIPEFERKRRFSEYATNAIEWGKEGIKQNPESVIIRRQLAEVYKEKIKDPCAIARLWAEIVDLPGAPEFADRFVGYYLEECPGKEREAYDHLRRLYYEGEHNHVASLIIKIKDLEKELDVLPALRIPDPYPQIPGRTQNRGETSGDQ